MRLSIRAGRFVFVFGMLLAACAGCSNAPSTNTPQSSGGQSVNSADVRPTVDVKPDADKAVVVGQAVDQATAQPLPNVIVRLAEIYWDNDHKNAALALDEANSPSAKADANGFFSFKNIPSREYAIIFRNATAFDGSGDVIVPETNNQDKAHIINPAKGQVTDLGQVKARKP